MYLGRYTVKETNTLPGYSGDPTAYTATLSYEGGSKPAVRPEEGIISYRDARQKVQISAIRKDKNGNPVPGSIIGLYAKDDIVNGNGDVLVRKDTLLETQQADAGGAARFTADLPCGWYYVKELIPAYGYKAVPGQTDVDASATGDGAYAVHRNAIIR